MPLRRRLHRIMNICLDEWEGLQHPACSSVGHGDRINASRRIRERVRKERRRTGGLLYETVGLVWGCEPLCVSPAQRWWRSVCATSITNINIINDDINITIINNRHININININDNSNINHHRKDLTRVIEFVSAKRKVRWKLRVDQTMYVYVYVCMCVCV